MSHSVLGALNALLAFPPHIRLKSVHTRGSDGQVTNLREVTRSRAAAASDSLVHVPAYSGRRKFLRCNILFMNTVALERLIDTPCSV